MSEAARATPGGFWQRAWRDAEYGRCMAVGGVERGRGWVGMGPEKRIVRTPYKGTMLSPCEVVVLWPLHAQPPPP